MFRCALSVCCCMLFIVVGVWCVVCVGWLSFVVLLPVVLYCSVCAVCCIVGVVCWSLFCFVYCVLSVVCV